MRLPESNRCNRLAGALHAAGFGLPMVFAELCHPLGHPRADTPSPSISTSTVGTSAALGDTPRTSGSPKHADRPSLRSDCATRHHLRDRDFSSACRETGHRSSLGGSPDRRIRIAGTCDAVAGTARLSTAPVTSRWFLRLRKRSLRSLPRTSPRPRRNEPKTLTVARASDGKPNPPPRWPELRAAPTGMAAGNCLPLLQLVARSRW